jgi:hypothetical protein
MTVTPENILRQVQTYQKAELAYLQNLYCFITLANKKFKNFQDEIAQLGQTVTIQLPFRSHTTNSLNVTFEGIEMRYQPLVCDQPISSAQAFTNEDFIFTVEDYMKEIGMSAVSELGSQIEQNVALNAVSHTYRFYGNGVDPINSFGQVMNSLARYRNYGTARTNTNYILPDVNVPDIVSSGLNQFVLKRNEDLANSWELGTYSNCKFVQSNLLPIHQAGTIGDSNLGSHPTPITLTVISTNDPTGAAITQITCVSSGAANDPNAIKKDDLLQFSDGVSGQPNLRYLTFIGHAPSAVPVQIRATADAGTDGSKHITINITPTLDCQPDKNQNLSYNIVAGMVLTAIPTHRAGLVLDTDALFLAMPRLPTMTPFPTANETDADSGTTVRVYHGSLLGQDFIGLIHDAIWGSTLIDEYAMRVCFPVE